MKKSKIIIVLTISLVFCFSLLVLLNLPKIPKEEANDAIKYYNYEDLGINSSKKPSEPWLLCETDDGSLYISPGGGDSGEIYKSTDKAENWTQPNGDFSIGSGIHAFWLDQPNDKLYGASDGDIFYIDLTNDSITDLGVPIVGASEPGNAKFSLDVWVMGGDIYCGIFYYDLGVEHFYSINKWGGAAWAEEDKIVWNVVDYPQYWVSLGVVIGGIYYFVEYDGVSSDSKIYSFTAATSTIALLDTVSSTSTTNSRVMSYDGVDIIYFMLEVSTVRKLHGYTISGGSTTEYGDSEIMMMRDCMTGAGLMEKAYHTTEYKVYQLHPNVKHQLYFIAKIPSTTAIIAITDNFLICNDVGTNEFPVYEYVDVSNYMVRVEFVHEIQMASKGTLGVVRDEITIAKGMFMQIIGTFATANLPRVYKGTYNFEDESVGTSGTDIEFVDTAVLYDGACEIVSDWQSHKKVLRLTDDVTPGENPYILHNITQATSGTHEFWIGTNDVTEYWEIFFYESGHDYIIRLRITASNLYYRDNVDAWQEIQAVANDTLYRIKAIWRADNTFDLWVDEILKVDNQATNHNQVSGINNFRIRTYGDSTDYIYLDAYGEGEDANYDVGDNLVVEGGETDQVIFEGIVVDFDGERLQKVWLESPAKKELERKPRGDFSGRSDEIMTTLLSTYCKYITKGTFSIGTVMGTITYAGDKTLQTIFNELALFEKWVWKLDPQGRLYFNDGTVDTLVDLSKTDKIWMVKTGEIREPYNYFYLKGAIVNGVQLVKELEEADDLASQQLHGYNPFEKTYASFNTQTILDQLTSNAKAKLKLTPLVVEHWHYDADLGMLAIMETVTFVYDTTNVNVSSDQFLINRVIFKAEQNAGGYTIADELV